jgi:hypothetical protein
VPRFAGATSEGAAGGDEAAGLTLSEAFRTTPAYAAEIVAGVTAVTAAVPTVKLALVAPTATVTLACTVAALELLDNVTSAPPLGAGAVKTTLPADGVPPTTLPGFNDIADRVGTTGGGAVTVSISVRDTPLKVAVSSTLTLAATTVLVRTNVAAVAPAGTVTLDGVVAAVELSDRVTTAPPLGAAAVKATAPVRKPPPTTLPALSDSDDSVALVAAAGEINKSAVGPGELAPC